MTMTTINTQDLTGAALDWAVAIAEGLVATIKHNGVEYVDASGISYGGVGQQDWTPSTNPAQGHPVIEREGIATRKHSSGKWYAMAQADVGDGQRADWNEFTWRNAPRYPDYPHEQYQRRQRFSGSTMLIAGLRCLVAARLGPTIDVPQELAP